MKHCSPKEEKKDSKCDRLILHECDKGIWDGRMHFQRPVSENTKDKKDHIPDVGKMIEDNKEWSEKLREKFGYWIYGSKVRFSTPEMESFIASVVDDIFKDLEKEGYLYNGDDEETYNIPDKYYEVVRSKYTK